MANVTTTNGENWLARLAALSDRSRVRILLTLEQAELGVGELSRSLGMPQSTVSRHLKPLFELGFVNKRSEGTASLYRLNLVDPAIKALWKSTCEQLGDAEDFADDAVRLRQVLLDRRIDSRSFFGRVGGDWQSIRRDLFGHGFSDDALLQLLPSEWVVADLGCGTGDAAERLAPVVSRVLAVDREPAMLTAAQRRLEAFSNIEFLEGDLLRLPIENASVDLAVLILVLHHQEDPAGIMRESARILKPEGRLLIVDMMSHDRTEFTEEMGHIHLGFDEDALVEWGVDANLVCMKHHRMRPMASGRGPALFCSIFGRT